MDGTPPSAYRSRSNTASPLDVHIQWSSSKINFNPTLSADSTPHSVFTLSGENKAIESETVSIDFHSADTCAASQTGASAANPINGELNNTQPTTQRRVDNNATILLSTGSLNYTLDLNQSPSLRGHQPEDPNGREQSPNGCCRCCSPKAKQHSACKCMCIVIFSFLTPAVLVALVVGLIIGLAPKVCDNNQCQNGAQCVEVGSFVYRCSCPPHYYGRTCQLAGDNDPDPYHCSPSVCPQDYQPEACQESCSGNGKCVTYPCLYQGTCVSTTGSYSQCQCEPGYTGYSCDEIYSPPGTSS